MNNLHMRTNTPIQPTRLNGLLRLFCVVAMASVLSACSTLVAPPKVALVSAGAAQAAWAQVLKTYVTAQGDVDFQALALAPNELQTYVRFVADTSLDTFADGPQRLAHMINSYNALSMYNVLQSGIPQTHAGLNKVKFFALRKFEIGGRLLSLYGYENDIIRPYTRARRDPRVHFALNCSARSCPVLPRTPFMAETLERELERETISFFARPENYRVDDATQTVWLSELLNFYPEDFVPDAAPSLVAYAARYAALPPGKTPPPSSYVKRFVPYDWTIANAQKPGSP